MRSLLLSLVLASSFALLACGGNATPASSPVGASSTAPSAAAAATSSDVMKPGEAKIGDKSTCLVSGEEFVVAADSPSADYEGKTYYFCCPPCVGKFKADPKKYVH